MNGGPYHKRLPDWEAFDEISLRVVPRYKMSGLSGDEWRQHIAIVFSHKGVPIVETGCRDMKTAILMLGTHFLQNQSPIADRVLELEQTSCDQPSCRAKIVTKRLLKRQTARDGEWLDMSQQHFRYYRQFCKEHARRGDCSREDSDDNYEPMDGDPNKAQA